VSYLNTRPLLLGIEQPSFLREIELMTSYPSKIAAELVSGNIDIGLVPVAVIPELKHAQIVTDYCIGAEGIVASVAIFSKKPIDQIKKIYLDYQSRTSVALAQILIKLYWKLDIEFIHAPEDFIDLIEGDTAAVIIGDRALMHLKDFEYVYDLALTWKTFTGYPFVFAAWVANQEVPEDFIDLFNKANAMGLNRIDDVVAGIEAKEQIFDLKKYYTENISYPLTEEKKKGLALFLKYLSEHPVKSV
jgi:chorismate dehydratase